MTKKKIDGRGKRPPKGYRFTIQDAAELHGITATAIRYRLRKNNQKPLPNGVFAWKTQREMRLATAA